MFDDLYELEKQEYEEKILALLNYKLIQNSWNGNTLYITRLLKADVAIDKIQLNLTIER